MNILSIPRFALNKIKSALSVFYRKSYSQSGEDLIIDYLFGWMRIEKPTYLDIGAHHPKWLSNTYFFYKKGCRGVCVEPDPALFEYFRRKRSGDVCLNVGVSMGEETNADFYMMTQKTLNTFSRQDAENSSNVYLDCKIEKVVKIDLVDINYIIKEHFGEKPNFLSIDVEGLDLQLLQTLDFNLSRPEIICIETINYTEKKSLIKSTKILEYMKSNDYFVYADTFINTIFVDRRAWHSRNVGELDNI